MTIKKAKIVHTGTIVDGVLDGWIFGEYEVAISTTHTDGIIYGGHTVDELQSFARQSNDGVDFLAVVERAFLDIRGVHRVMPDRYDENENLLPPRIVFIAPDAYFEMMAIRRLL